MAMKILALDGLTDARLCKLMNALLQTVPGVEYANIDYLSQKLTLQISSRDSASVVEKVAEVLRKNMPGVTMRYLDVEEDSPGAKVKPPQSSAAKRSGVNLDLSKAAQTIKTMIAESEDRSAPADLREAVLNGGAAANKEKNAEEQNKSAIEIPRNEINDEEIAKKVNSQERHSSIRAMLMQSNGEISDAPKPEDDGGEVLENSENSKQTEENTGEQSGAQEITEKFPTETAEEQPAETAEKQLTEDETDSEKPEEQPTEKPTFDFMAAMNKEFEEAENSSEEAETQEETENSEEVQAEESQEEAEEGEENEENAENEENTENEENEGVEDKEAEVKAETEEDGGWIDFILHGMSREEMRHWIFVLISLLAFMISLVFPQSGAAAIAFQAAAFLILAVISIISDPGEDNELLTMLNSVLITLSASLMFFTGARVGAMITMFSYNAAFFVICRMHKKFKDYAKSTIDIKPKTLTAVLDNNEFADVEYSMSMGQTPILVNPGQAIPFDGYVIKGETELDCSFLTGIEEPVKIKVGDRVNCGDINLNSPIQIIMINIQENSFISRVYRRLEDANADRSENVAAARRIAFITSLMVVAAMAGLIAFFLITKQLEKCMYIIPLMIALISPGAIVPAGKMAQIGSLFRGLKQGVVFGDVKSLTDIAAADTVVCGYSGIFTTGECVITQVVPEEGVSEEEIVHAAAYAEYNNADFPFSRAIVEYYEKKYGKKVVQSHIAFCDIFKGGVSTMAESCMIVAGDEEYMQKVGVEILATADDRRCVYIAQRGKWIGRIYYEDPLRKGASRLLRRLKSMGITKTVMLTGLSKKEAQAANKNSGFDEIYAEHTIADKPKAISRVASARGDAEKVIFVGDATDGESISNICPCIVTGEEAIVRGINYGKAMIPSSNPDKIRDAFKIARQARLSVDLNVYVSAALKLMIILFGIFTSMPLGFVGLLMSVLLVLEVLNPSLLTKMGVVEYGMHKANSSAPTVQGNKTK